MIVYALDSPAVKHLYAVDARLTTLITRYGDLRLHSMRMHSFPRETIIG